MDRIIQLIRSCRYSFHDLSRVSLDRNPPATPRFNMPFELGLAAMPRRSRAHDWFVFEEQRHRLMKSLSDLNGTDPHIHDGEPEGVLRALTNALVRRRHRSTSLFEARSFDELVMAGRISAERRIPSLRRRRRPAIEAIERFS